MNESWKGFMIEAEKTIERFKKAPVLYLEHTNDYVTNSITYRCNGCGERVKATVETATPIHPEVIRCPYCDRHTDMAHLNLNIN